MNWLFWPDAFSRRIELNPNDAAAREGYGLYLDESIAEGQKSTDLDPLSLEFNANLGWDLIFARRYDDAVRQFRRTIDLDPDYWFALNGLASALEKQGDLSEALERAYESRAYRYDRAPGRPGHGFFCVRTHDSRSCCAA